MPTVEEVLLQSGFAPAEIAALDQRARGAFGQVLSAAEQAREQAQLAQRSNVEFYENQIVPSLNSWELEKNQIENERARFASEAAFYRTQAEEAKKGGFVPSDSPTFGSQQRGADGRYIAGPEGSPTFTPNDIEAKLAMGLGNVAWALQSYQRLHGGTLPDDIDRLAEEATRAGRPFRDHVSQKYNFVGKEKELAEKRQREHDDKIRDEATKAEARRWAERAGSNPDVKPAITSRLGEVARGVQSGQRKDPLLMNDAERQRETRASIHKRIAEREEQG